MAREKAWRRCCGLGSLWRGRHRISSGFLCQPGRRVSQRDRRINSVGRVAARCAGVCGRADLHLLLGRWLRLGRQSVSFDVPSASCSLTSCCCSSSSSHYGVEASSAHSSRSARRSPDICAVVSSVARKPASGATRAVQTSEIHAVVTPVQSGRVCCVVAHANHVCTLSVCENVRLLCHLTILGLVARSLSQ